MSRIKNRLRKSTLVGRLSSRRVKNISLIALAAVVGLAILVQLFYPSNRALPFSSLANQPIGGRTADELRVTAGELYEKSTIEVRGRDKVMVARTASAVGVVMDEDGLIEQVLRYPWWLRLVPFSMLWAGPELEEFPASVDQQRLDEFIQSNQDSFAIPAENAQLAVEGTKVMISGGSQGARLSPDQFEGGVRAADYVLGGPTVLAVKFTFTDPAIRKSDLEQLQSWVQGVVNSGLSLEFEGVRVAVDAGVVASWLVIEQEEIDSIEAIKFSLNSEVVVQFVKEHFDKIIVQPAGVTEVYLIDGVEQSRRVGVSGRALDEGAIVAELEAALLGNGDAESVEVPARVVAPRINKNHTFTKSQAGLQAYVNSLQDEGDIRVTVSQIGGRGWRASYRGAEQTVSASTYKVYVVAYALNQITEGKLTYDDKINNMSLRQCIERTIIQSDNACPEAMMKEFGRTNLNNFLYSRGYSRATTFTNMTASQTTTNDLVKAMIEIDNGQLVRGGERSFMLRLMGQTIHRQGIVAGSSGTTYNKVGFLWSYLNDAAIVNHPGGKYAISIMTEGQSWAKIAEITRKVEGIMY